MSVKPNELQVIRAYDAPVKLVWEVWTDLGHVSKWWGPRGFTLTTKSKDFSLGGKWIYTMHGPDGTNYSNITTYHEIEEYKKMVYDHGGNEERDKLFTVTVTFNEVQGKTIMTMISAFSTDEEARAMNKFIKEANGLSTWDRLGEYLENKISGKDLFIINRTFEASCKTVFDMWVNPEHLVKWMGPIGSTMSFISANIKEGEGSHYEMTNADGLVMYGKVKYQNIRPHELLIYTQNFCDKEGNLSKPPFFETWPDMLLTTVTFAQEDKDETRVTVKWEVHRQATSAERQEFHEAKTGMMVGWNGSFDKLESFLREKIMSNQVIDNNVEGILFDIDGTLIDSNDAHTKAWLEAFAESNIKIDYNSIRNKIGMGSDHLIPELIKVSKESQIGKKIDERQGEIFRTQYLPSLKSFPGAKDLLQLLKDKGLKLIVASSSSAKDLTELLKIDGLINYFDNLNMATSDTQSKPDPDIILNALSKGDLSKDKALMIGDTPYDIEAAMHAGVKVIAFTCGGWSVKDLNGAIAIYEGPKHFLENLPDL